MSTLAANLQPLSRENFLFMRDLLKKETAIVLADGKEYLVETRLATIATRHGFGSVNDLVAHLRTSFATGPGTPRAEVIDALTTNETLFFRDLAPFDALRDTIIPELATRSAGAPLSIWSAACSSGQEAYSLTMLMAEHHPTINYRIVGTDISSKVLDKAKSGTYLQHEINRGLPAKLLIKHFRQQAGAWIISEDLRRRVEFRYLNLIGAWTGLPKCDLILMRNVLIYFDVETRRDILRQARMLLRPGGYLSLGGAETTVQIDPAFTPVTVGRATFFRVN
ncbi:CheR family methyltransferase [Actomonas aquatica]|uniref:protein-glutamate O-methyltransferase n=1 Tax=Actomonas aquatica TaxID=2866162 RepID=A0ABZ1CDD7_9BACT|nr:protein-glutamate O-methyltransferase CheR [Opitutus sp. WL0086]WRQ89431.1 protein-glutamate O-methyltransferase CheR [Opitutus sp. WL0086]